jgi:HlyD family secretion protein
MKMTRPTDEPNRGPDPIDEAMAVTSSAGWIALAAVAAVVLGAVAWAALADVPIKVKARGVLLSPEGVAEVSMGSRGRIERMDVRPGDLIEQGDLIAEIIQPDQEMQLAVKEVQLREARLREEGLIDVQARSRQAQANLVQARITSAQQRLGLYAEREKALRERENVLNGLLAKSLVGKEAVLRNHAELVGVLDQAAAAKTEIVTAANELHQQQIQGEKELLTVREELARLSAEVTETEALLTHNRELHSPFAGRVIEVKYNAGDFVEAGAPVIALDRAAERGHLMAVAFVPPDNGKEVRVGMNVQIAPSAVKANEYGFIVGRVTAVSDSAATSAGIQRVLRNDVLVKQLTGQGAPFQIGIKLDAADTPTGYRWTSSNGPQTPIDSGTPVEAYVVTRQSRALGLLVPPLARFFAR